jgi:hypothetical protein
VVYMRWYAAVTCDSAQAKIFRESVRADVSLSMRLQKNKLCDRKRLLMYSFVSSLDAELSFST